MLAVPHHRQSTNWTCGPACLTMILAYYGRKPDEMAIAERVGCTPALGVDPGPMVSFLKDEGYRLKSKFGWTLEEVAKCLAKGWPVIVAYQDWAHKPSATDYATCWDNGHYAIVIGLKPDRVWLVDPSSERKRRSLHANDFLGRWRDLTEHGRQYHRWGVAVGARR